MKSKEIVVCSNCGLTKKEHKSMLFFGRNGKYCHKFRTGITLKEYENHPKTIEGEKK